MADIFLSYSRKDKQRAEHLVRRLEGEGWSVFWDTQILSGDGWARKIKGELDAARCVITAWSRDAVQSRWVRTEADMARDRGVLMPVSLDGTTPPAGFGDLQFENLRWWNRWWNRGRDNAAIKRVLISLSQRLDPSAPLSRAPPPGDEPWIRFRHAIAATALLVAGAAALRFGYEPAYAELRHWRLSTVTEWGAQLQRVEPRELAVLNPLDLLVTDYSKDGAIELTGREVADLGAKPGQRRRIVLSYLSIGEAEDYRYYWQADWKKNRPTWLLTRNEDGWSGNYNVQYWSPEWQKILLGDDTSYLARIQRQGFDGVYLDLAKGVEFAARHGRTEAKADMIALIEGVARVARKTNPQFIILVQNGDALLGVDDARYLRSIDGVVREGLVFREGEADELSVLRGAEAIHVEMNQLGLVVQAGRTVFVMEYLVPVPVVDYLRSALLSNGFKPSFSTDRGLSIKSGYSKIADDFRKSKAIQAGQTSTVPNTSQTKP